MKKSVLAVHLAAIDDPPRGWMALDAVIAVWGSACVSWVHDGPMMLDWKYDRHPCPREADRFAIGIWVLEAEAWRRPHPVEMRMMEHGLLADFWMLADVSAVPLNTEMEVQRVARWANRHNQLQPEWSESTS